MEGKDGNLGLRLGTVVRIGGDERGWEVLSLSSFVFLSFLFSHSRIHGFNLGGVVAVDDGAAYFEGVGQLAGFHCEFFGEECEFFYFLE